jgi:hypothetical protein
VKGLVFTTFYDFCEVKHGRDFLDEVIDAAQLPNGGAYTSVGTYPFSDMVALIGSLVTRTGTELKATLEEFGAHCFRRWVEYWPHQFEGKRLFDVLATIDEFHESQVRKLYPDAELPSFQVEARTSDRLVLGYHSCKPLADLAAGVIKGAAHYLNEPISVRSEAAQSEEGMYVRIHIDRLG